MSLLCQKPFRRGVNEYGCGKCMPCRMRRRKLWTSRLLLEARMHLAALFVTLTYNDKHLPKDGSVSVRDVQLFLKRLRRLMQPVPVRYFMVGEYGEQSHRPHYHGILFAAALDSDVISSAWTLGFVHIGEVNEKSAAYLVGYTLKGMTDANEELLKGRRPEFARMSLRGGIGVGAIEAFSRALVSSAGSRSLYEGQDVPLCYRTDGRLQPFGRYLRSKLRESVGWDHREPEVARRTRESNLALSLAQPGAFVAREDKRQQDAWVADARYRRSNLKRRVV